MKKLSEYYNEILHLVQPSQLKRECELHSSEGVLMKTYFLKRIKSEAVVEGFDGKWIFKKPSIWKSSVEVSKVGFNYPIAIFKRKNFSYGGTIYLPRGQQLRLESKVLKDIYTVFTDTNEELIVIKKTGVIKKKTDVMLGKRKLETVDEHPWLPMLVWYIMLQNLRQSIAGVYYS